MAEEIRQHVDVLTDRNIAAGMSPTDARSAALRQFGGVEQIKEIAVIAYGIGQRTREIGLRLALGPTYGGVLRMILTEGFRLVLGGLVLGLLATIAIIKLISAQLYRVSARDPLSLILVTLLLAAISLFACWMAARRASRIDPAIALRAD